MKREPSLSQIWAVIVSFCLSFGGVAAMVTAFSLEENLVVLVFGCALWAVLATFLMRWRFGWVGYSLLLGLMLLSKRFWLQGKFLCLQITQIYSAGYGFEVPGWLQDAEQTTMILPLLFIAGIVAVVAVWTILYRRRAFWAVGVALLPLISCLIVTVTVPDNFAIVFLLGALALLILTQSTRRQDSHQGNRLCGMLSVPIVAGLLLLMALVPRESYRPIRFPDWMSYQYGQSVDTPQEPQLQNKLDSHVDLTHEGYRKMSKAAVMDITTDYNGKLYLRGRHYHTYTGTAWNSNLTLQETFITPSKAWASDANYSITISYRKTADYRHIPYYPKQSQRFNGGMVLGSTKEPYSYTFSPLRANWRQQWLDLSTSPPHQEYDYLHLSQETLEWAGPLVLQLQSPTSAWNTLSVAQAVEKYVQNSATYSLDTPRPPADTEDFVYWFLNESDTGYCVHFASAATVLLRAAGVPARYVEGYTVDVNSQKTTISGDMAHAWVEYYVEDLGWVIMDPTPADSEQPTPPATTTPTQPSQPTAPSTTTQATTSAPASTVPTTAKPEEPSVPESETSRVFRKLLWCLLGIVAGLLLLVGQWLTRRWWKLRKLRQGHPNRQALARYVEAKRLAKLRHFPVPDELRTLAEKAKFSNHPLTRPELGRFDAFCAESIQALCEEHWYWPILLRLVFALC